MVMLIDTTHCVTRAHDTENPVPAIRYLYQGVSDFHTEYQKPPLRTDGKILSLLYDGSQKLVALLVYYYRNILEAWRS